MLKEPASGKLSNQVRARGEYRGSDGGAAIAAGNGRVVQARLSDAKFFFETDLKVKLEDRLAKLDHIIFHEKLGSQGERAKRLEGLARDIAPLTLAPIAISPRARRVLPRPI